MKISNLSLFIIGVSLFIVGFVLVAQNILEELFIGLTLPPMFLAIGIACLVGGLGFLIEAVKEIILKLLRKK